MITDSIQTSKYLLHHAAAVPPTFLLNVIMKLCCCGSRREEIIEYIKRCFFLIKHKNMPMFHVTKKDLNDFTTTEKDMKKGISKFPTSDYRVSQGEDLFAQSLNLAHTQSVVDTTLQDDGVFAGN